MNPLLHVRCNAVAGHLRVDLDATLTAPWTVLFGASGSGKTSLLRLIAGLWRPAGAVVTLDDRDLSHLPAHRRRIALVAQHPALFPHRSVRANVAFGAGSSRQSGDVTDSMMERFRLQPLAQRHVAALSGGESQRVCLARAMATLPDALLLDESFSGLHRELRDELVEVLRSFQHGPRPMPIVSVTHDVGEAFLCADEVLRMDGGRIVRRGPAGAVLAADRDELLRRLRLS